MSTPSPSTAERIVETALKLFNEYGYSNVASLRIAMALGISPGHLAYHFRNKTDIVLAVFPKLEEELGKDLLEVTRPVRAFTAEHAALHQIEVFRILWKYRFVFNALTQLMQDAELHRRFLVLQENVVGATAQLFDDLISQGYMRPIRPPNSTRIMARNQWMVWLSWLRFEHIEHPHRETARNAAVHEGLVQGFCNIQPYFDDAFAAEMLAIVQRLLPDEEDAASRYAAVLASAQPEAEPPPAKRPAPAKARATRRR